MGYIKHNAIIVTSWGDDINKAKIKADKIFGEEFVSEVIESKVNGDKSFFIPPDGSKEGWESSDEGDMNRAEFVEWCKGKSIDYIEISYGGDEPELAHLVNHNK